MERQLQISSLGPDYTSNLPDDCLAYILHSLVTFERENCSFVCRRWLRIIDDGQNRHHLSVDNRCKLTKLIPLIPSLFARFHSVTELTLIERYRLRGHHINDQALILISLNCKNLTRLTLKFCRHFTSNGVESLAKNCPRLKMFSCMYSSFGGARGFNAILDNCTFLEELHVKKPGKIIEPIAPKKACSSLKLISLDDLRNFEVFSPLIINAAASESLTTLKLSGVTLSDELLMSISDKANKISEVYLRNVGYSGCDDGWVVMLAKRCKSLRKLHIHSFWNLSGETRSIGDRGLMAVAENCRELEELVLFYANPTKLSIEMLAVNCVKLERLTIVKGEMVKDEEKLCIAGKCNALKWLTMEHFSSPNVPSFGWGDV